MPNLSPTMAIRRSLDRRGSGDSRCRTVRRDPAKAFMTCTTCHNQHVMYVYAAPAGKQVGSAIAGGKYPTYFFINGPYNPGAGNTNPTKAASTTQFCRQCHTGESNEAAGVMNVSTAVLIVCISGGEEVSLPRFLRPEREKDWAMKKQRKNAMMTGMAAMVLALTCGAQVVASHAPTMAAPRPQACRQRRGGLSAPRESCSAGPGQAGGTGKWRGADRPRPGPRDSERFSLTRRPITAFPKAWSRRCAKARCR